MTMSGLDPIGDHYGPTYTITFIMVVSSLDPIGDHNRPTYSFCIFGFNLRFITYSCWLNFPRRPD